MGVTITKKELVNRIAEKTGVTKVVTKDIIQSFLDEIIEELGQGNRLEFREFGVFEVKSRAPRRAQNPRTLEKVEVPAKKVVKFKVGRLMKERVKKLGETPRPEPARDGAATKEREAETALGSDGAVSRTDVPRTFESQNQKAQSRPAGENPR
ncbi:MAG: HU family DNA-binding protein [Planctomycetota bacterium]